MNPADLKRMVLIDGDRSGIRKKAEESIRENRITRDEQIEIGRALEGLTQSRGWAYIEAYIFRNANLSEILLDDNPVRRHEAAGLIKLIHYVNAMITLKNELLRADNEK